jgi:Tubulin/FtsZ family, GTPase domain
MRTVDRSLEITALGLGQAGGRIAAEFSRHGYRALALDNAKADLGSLGAGPHALPEAQRIYIGGVEGSDGATSDLDYGRECITAHAERIRAAVAEYSAGADVVLVAAGLGEGIGSCAPEFAALLREQGLPVVVLSTLPHHYESATTKVTALCAVRDLAQSPPCGWVMIDNEKLSRLHHDVPINAYFETINRAIVEPVDVWNRLNDRTSVRPIRAIGGEDLRTLLLGNGVISYYAQTLPKLGAAEVLETLRASLADNPIMPSGSELANVAYLALAIEASEGVLAETPFSLYEGIVEQTKRETGGAAVYVGLYSAPAENESTTVRVLSCAHALPASITELVAETQREAGAIQQKAAQHVGALDLGGLEHLRPKQAARSTRRRGAPPAEPAHAVEVPAVEPSPDAGSLRTETQTSPSRGRFERLANAFRDATADEERVKVAQELGATLQSSDALERFYAVNAMTRVDAAYFRDVLRIAARDSDRHVSDLARRALEKLSRQN